VLSNHSVNITNGVIISGDITTRHQFSWSQDLKSSRLILINSSSLIHIFILPLCCISVWKVETFESFFFWSKKFFFLLKFRLNHLFVAHQQPLPLPPHRVEDHRLQNHKPLSQFIMFQTFPDICLRYELI
jgi:hypothetical protein